MSKRDWVIDIIDQIVKNKVTSEMIVERLTEEGLLHVGYGKPEIDIILNKFSDTFGTTKASKYDRFSATRLAGKYGVQAVVGIIGALGANSREQYAPIVNNVSELESKMPSILNFLRNLKTGEELDV